MLSRVDAAYGFHRIGFLGLLVVAVALDARETQRQPAWVTRARLQVAERDFDDELGSHIDRPVVATYLAHQEFPRLPLEHRIGQALERLAEHHVLAGLEV